MTSHPHHINLLSPKISNTQKNIWKERHSSRSGLRDTWTDQLAKIRNKRSADLSSGSSSTAPEWSQSGSTKRKERRGTLIQWPPTLLMPWLKSAQLWHTLRLHIPCFLNALAPWRKTSCYLLPCFDKLLVTLFVNSRELCLMKENMFNVYLSVSWLSSLLISWVLSR